MEKCRGIWNLGSSLPFSGANGSIGLGIQTVLFFFLSVEVVKLSCSINWLELGRLCLPGTSSEPCSLSREWIGASYTDCYTVYKFQRNSYHSVGRTRQQLGFRSILSDLFPPGYRFAFPAAMILPWIYIVIFAVIASHSTLLWIRNFFYREKKSKALDERPWDFLIFTMYPITLKQLDLKKSGLVY